MNISTSPLFIPNSLESYIPACILKPYTVQ